MRSYICDGCPRSCHVLRGDTGSGFCREGAEPVLARAALHFDEEPVISGVRGSGAVFFSGCTLRCRFCQNYDISHGGFGKKVTVERLRQIYFELIDQGAHNINLVNPTHFAEAILQSLEGGLPVPVVWNTGGYERVDALKRLEGHVQVYLPDLKYIHAESARRYSAAGNYFEYAAPALKEMLRQTGPVELDDEGLIRRGVIVRHLILPGCTEESMQIIDWIAENLPGAWISLMAQYLPFGDVDGLDELGRRLTEEEFAIMQTHTVKSEALVESILKGVEEEHLVEMAMNVARHHHEKWNGFGYPDKLKGEEIPLEARIMAVADVYDALVSKRCYKEPMSFERAAAVMLESMGSHFDPKLEKVFLLSRSRLEEYYMNA